MATRVAVAVLAVAALVSSTLLATEERDGEIVVVAHQKSEMVLVPAGTFFMGFPDSEYENAKEACEKQLKDVRLIYLDMCPDDEPEVFRSATPFREVFVSAFEIDRYEVTVREYRECVAAGACDISPLVTDDDRHLEDSLPMVNVTWYESVDFCTWKKKRLPTEAEWEKAARGTDKRRWPWGNQDRDDGSNHGKLDDDAVTETIGKVTQARRGGPNIAARIFTGDDSDGYLYAAEPGALIWGESPYGAFDMAGNVSEWVEDYYDGGDSWSPIGRRRNKVLAGGYADLPDLDPVRLSPKAQKHRVVRGGSWVEAKMMSRVYRRDSADPSGRYFARGFRCARDVDVDSE